MTVRVDAKGKVFTDIVHKNELPALIQTATHLIHGHIYVRPEERLIDAFNSGAQFVAVTRAQVYGADGEVLYRAKFLALNTECVVWIRPDDDAAEAET